MSPLHHNAVIRRLLRGFALMIALVGTAAAHALSIGEISLQSRLGEPLRAVVPLGNIGTLSEDQILVGRASEELHRNYGVDRAQYNSPLRFVLSVDARGMASVMISTAQPLSEPFIDMVMEVRWPDGRAVKQFTLLLDLPPQ